MLLIRLHLVIENFVGIVGNACGVTKSKIDQIASTGKSYCTREVTLCMGRVDLDAQ